MEKARKNPMRRDGIGGISERMISKSNVDTSTCKCMCTCTFPILPNRPSNRKTPSKGNTPSSQGSLEKLPILDPGTSFI